MFLSAHSWLRFVRVRNRKARVTSIGVSSYLVYRLPTPASSMADSLTGDPRRRG